MPAAKRASLGKIQQPCSIRLLDFDFSRHLGRGSGDAAIELNARPSEALRVDTLTRELVGEEVIVRLLAAVLEQQRNANDPVCALGQVQLACYYGRTDATDSPQACA